MQNELKNLNGVVENVTFQNEDSGFAVINIADSSGEIICVVGPLAGTAPGEELFLEGNYIQHPSYGLQFEAVSCIYKMPDTEEGILKYLSSRVLPGIGPVAARNIVAKFGSKALEIIATSPESLAEVKGISLSKAEGASKRFLEIFGAREAVTLLAQLGFSAAEALLVYKQLGASMADEIRKNPYVLCGYPLYINFLRADAVAEAYAYDKGNIQRVEAAVIYVLRHNRQNGHTCLPKNKMLETVRDFFTLDPSLCESAFGNLLDKGDLQTVSYSDKEYIYLSDVFATEMSAALRLRDMIKIPTGNDKDYKLKIEQCEKQSGVKYAKEQKNAIKKAMSCRTLVITGGPGTGKTTTVNAIINLFEQQADRVLLAAPTGRAAKRMSDLTNRTASTIHRLLEMAYTPGSEFPFYGRNEQNPLKCDVLIVDEMSMVDVFLFESLLRALLPSCRLIMVGDTDQLPSVGAGNVLKGIIESEVLPVVTLNKIFRQAASSLIVSNAHRIVAGELPQNGGKKDDYFFIKEHGIRSQKLLCDLVQTRLPASYNFLSSNDIQVLCPGRKGMMGTLALNMVLQELLNPHEHGKKEIKFGDTVFRMGDKVMQIKNNYNISFTSTGGEPGAGAFNGDIGFIEDINPSTGSVTVLCEDRHVYYTFENMHELELAYAITVHKSQGSEFEAVVLALSEVPGLLRYRNLLYTAITRARKLCVAVGEEEVLLQMVANGRKNARFSCFSDILKDENLV